MNIYIIMCEAQFMHPFARINKAGHKKVLSAT